MSKHKSHPMVDDLKLTDLEDPLKMHLFFNKMLQQSVDDSWSTTRWVFEIGAVGQSLFRAAMRVEGKKKR